LALSPGESIAGKHPIDGSPEPSIRLRAASLPYFAASIRRSDASIRLRDHSLHRLGESMGLLAGSIRLGAPSLPKFEAMKGLSTHPKGLEAPFLPGRAGPIVPAFLPACPEVELEVVACRAG
jgi:hypothetical protein